MVSPALLWHNSLLSLPLCLCTSTSISWTPFFLFPCSAFTLRCDAPCKCIFIYFLRLTTCCRLTSLSCQLCPFPHSPPLARNIFSCLLAQILFCSLKRFRQDLVAWLFAFNILLANISSGQSAIPSPTLLPCSASVKHAAMWNWPEAVLILFLQQTRSAMARRARHCQIHKYMAAFCSCHPLT